MKRLLLFLLVFPIFFISLLWSIPSMADDNGDAPRKGPSFTDWQGRVEVQEEWKEKTLSREPWAEGVDIAVSVDQHLYPALLASITEFSKKQGYTTAVHEGTCGISAGLLMGKSVDIGGFCCPTGSNDRLPGLKFHTIGIAGLAIIVHPDNPINNLTLERVRDIFQGKITSWDQVMEGLPKRPIRVIGRLHCKNRPGHWRLLLDNEELFSSTMIEVGTIKDMMERVAGDPWAMGYEVVWNREHYKEDAPVKYIKINNADPASPEDVASLRYPLYRVYNITSWENESSDSAPSSELIRHLISFSDRIDPKFSIVPVSLLRKYGWKFAYDELVGEP